MGFILLLMIGLFILFIIMLGVWLIAYTICENIIAERELKKLDITFSQNTFKDKNKGTLYQSINSSTTYSEEIDEYEEEEDMEDSYDWQWKKIALTLGGIVLLQKLISNSNKKNRN